MQPPPDILDGVLLRLRRQTIEDAPTLFLAAANPEVARYMDWPAPTAPLSEAESRERLAAAAQKWADGTEYQWVIEERSSHQVAGRISCRVEQHAADFGYFLARSHWGKGLASEAAGLVVNWLKAQPGICRIWATADAENLRSHKTLERLGLRREGILRMATYRPNIGGLPRDTAIYAWCKNDG